MWRDWMEVMFNQSREARRGADRHSRTSLAGDAAASQR
jgi:hypothetical protein